MQWRTTCIHRDNERFWRRGVGRSQVFLRGGASQRGGVPNETGGARLWVGGEGGGGGGGCGGGGGGGGGGGCWRTRLSELNMDLSQILELQN